MERCADKMGKEKIDAGKQEFYLKTEMEHELTYNILPFWIRHAVDNENGGFYGKVSNDLKVDKTADKGGVLNARILWVYSEAYRLYKEDRYKRMAERAFTYICDHFIDKDYGGLYWLVDYKGAPKDTRKQTYAQAFAIYAFSAYYKATGEKAALGKAIEIFGLLEKYGEDKSLKGFYEACDRTWAPSDLYLDEKCSKEKKSMNTMLHVLEAFNGLYGVWKDDSIREKLRETIEVMLDNVLDSETGHFKTYFDDAWESLEDECSYGHDIEGSWLLTEAASAVGDESLMGRVAEASIKMAHAVLHEGTNDKGAIVYEGKKSGVRTEDKLDWWPQAEGIVGFINAYEMTGDGAFLDAALKTWQFTKENIVDERFGEWIWGVTRVGKKINPGEKVSMWKCPYHNARACMEIMLRVKAEGE
jgi:mannobiose 2-epimerase